MFEGDYARISQYGGDQTLAVNEVLRGLTEYLRLRTGLTDEERSAIQGEIDYIRSQASSTEAVSAGATQKQLESLYMKAGTQAYEQFADMDKMVKEIQDMYGIGEAAQRRAIIASRQRATEAMPQVKAAFADRSKNIVSSIREETDVILSKSAAIREAGTTFAESDYNSLRMAQIAAQTKIYESVSAARAAALAAGETFGGKETLDLVESTLARLQRALPYGEAERILGSETITEGDDLTLMQEIFGQVRARLIGKAQAARTDLAAATDPRLMTQFSRAIETSPIPSGIFGDAVPGNDLAAMVMAEVGGSSRLPSRIEDTTAEQAAGIIKGIRKYERSRGSAIDADEQYGLRILKELMGQRKKESAILDPDSPITPEAANAFRHFFGGRRAMSEAEDAAGALLPRLMDPSDVPASAIDDIVSPAEDLARSGVARTAYKRIGDSFRDGALGEAFRNPIIRRGAMAAVALAGFGFVYSARKDHTDSDVIGPPMLPGGSAYEEGYPRQMAQPSSPSMQGQQGPGMQYKVYTSGSQEDAERLSSILGGVVDGPINSTMYNSLPQLGRDPYSSVASSF